MWNKMEEEVTSKETRIEPDGRGGDVEGDKDRTR